MEITLSRPLRWSAVFLITFIVCTAGSMPVFVTSLVVQEIIIYLLTLLMMGLLAAITASWISNLLTSDSTRSRILRITSVTEIVAILLVFFRGLFYSLQLGPNILKLATWGIVISTAAYLVARKFRSTVYNRRRDFIISIAMLALAPIVVVATIGVASQGWKKGWVMVISSAIGFDVGFLFSFLVLLAIWQPSYGHGILIGAVGGLTGGASIGLVSKKRKVVGLLSLASAIGFSLAVWLTLDRLRGLTPQILWGCLKPCNLGHIWGSILRVSSGLPEE